MFQRTALNSDLSDAFLTVRLRLQSLGEKVTEVKALLLTACQGFVTSI